MNGRAKRDLARRPQRGEPFAEHMVAVRDDLLRAGRAVAQVRKQLSSQKPSLGRGRPTQTQRAAARTRARLQAQIGDLLTHRFLFVQRHLTDSEQANLKRISRGQPHLQVLRTIMDEIYQLFDRRCHTDTVLAKLRKLRQRVQRFTTLSQVLKGLFSGNVEKALTFLDDRLLGATSNAVERANRRFRKMQKTVYRVRTAEHVRARIALDLFREANAPPRSATLNQFHRQRRAPLTLWVRYSVVFRHFSLHRANKPTPQGLFKVA